ncbi:penicillin-binding protein activator LpoB [Sulfurospirillum sp. 1612]|uniref:penicillin-binding protein activator LpoB n=1 Tax=Sulfurospirillum sp. 1612 TaxID=3094835 RepID=UPI002F927795
MRLLKTATKLVFSVAATTLFLTGCNEQPRYLDANHPESNKAQTLGLDYQDFRKASSDAIQSMLQSGALNRPGGGRYVLAISTIINDTTQRIDMDQLVKSIRISLLQSGKVIVTTAVRAGGAEDTMSYEARQLRNSDEFNQKTVAQKGQMIAPDFSLSGKIIQRDATLATGETKVDYYIQLTLTDIKTGLAYWEGETVITKAGSGKTVNW